MMSEGGVSSKRVLRFDSGGRWRRREERMGHARRR